MPDSMRPVDRERSTDDQLSISLILPAWNERDALPRAIKEADAALRAVADDYEIVVVDDGSSDGSAQCVQELASTYPALRLLRHENNQGYGAALRTGFTAARCDLIMFTDADAQFDLGELSRFVLLAKDYDIVCGYRIDHQGPPLRRFYSRGYNQLVRLLLRTQVRDVDCAFKVFRRDVLKSLDFTTNGFLVNAEILTLARQQEYTIVEVGVTHRPRTEGHSTVSAWHIPSVFSSLIRFWWNHVLFPGPSSNDTGGPGEESSRPDTTGRILWLQAALLVVAAFLLLTGLSYPLIDRDETRYGEIAREMIETGDWLVPHLNFRTYCDKPPLFYWACAASYKVFGTTESSARLIPALCGMTTLFTTMWFGNRLFSRRIGLLSGIVLLFSVGFLGTSRVLLIDGLLTSCVAISLFTSYEALRSGSVRLSWWICAGLACGLGFLTKGPVALVLLVPPVFAFAWLSKHVAMPRSRIGCSWVGWSRPSRHRGLSPSVFGRRTSRTSSFTITTSNAFGVRFTQNHFGSSYLC
ncbi:MAG: glycosyltransferase [Pirellulales bacterium]